MSEACSFVLVGERKNNDNHINDNDDYS